jgi:predicted RNA binding protein YcfA (HicA-like mRNA interferase family)
VAAPPLISGKECVAGLARLGYVKVRQKGSHVRLECAGRAPLTVPMHDELDRGTLRSILKVAGITPEQFEELLR